MKNTSSYILKRTIRMVRPFWGLITLSFFLGLITIPLALIKPLSLTILIDSGFGSQPLPGIIDFLIPGKKDFSFSGIVLISASLVIILAIIENIHAYVIWVLNTHIGERLVLNLRSQLFHHVQRLSLSYHDIKGTSHTSYHIQWDTVGVRTLILGNLIPLISSLISLVAMLAIMFYINWHFALIAICILPPLVLIIKYSSDRIRKDWDKVKSQESTAASVVSEVLSSVRIVKAFGQESNESKRFERQADKAVKGQIRIAHLAAIFSGVSGVLLAIGTATFIYFGANYVRSGQMTIGELTLVLAYLAQITRPLESIIKIMNDIQASLSSLNRVYNLLDEEKEVKEDAHSVHLLRSMGAIKFENVSFGYSKGVPILSNITFEIQPGDRVGIIGTTGAGKSTLISLLSRFYDASEGKILIDGENIRKFKLPDYRNQFGIVLQDPVLLSSTIAENILYGKTGASEQEIIDAAKAANAHDFILKLPNGYNTEVGERGALLSGGERQRISIARAFIKNAPILILDEPTSSVDVKTEGQIMEAMERLMKGRTTFMITHRLDTLRSCNVLLHLEKGRVLELKRDFDKSFLEGKKNEISEALGPIQPNSFGSTS